MSTMLKIFCTRGALLATALALSACGGGGGGGDGGGAILYTLSAAVVGGGSITSSPTGISCSVAGSDCTEAYAQGTAVSLTATPTSGNVFTGWSGACTGTGSCSVTINGDTAVTANFANSTVALEVIKTGGGTGTVTSDPAAINCGTTCTASRPRGSSITLTATPDANQTFDRWTGAAGCSTAASCTLTLTADRTTVQARFNTAPVTNVTATISGLGTVTSNPAGISCTGGAGGSNSGDCAESYTKSSMVTFTAAATSSGSNRFLNWSGGAAGCGTSTSCTLTMSLDNLNVVANFGAGTNTLSVSVLGSGTVTSNPTGITCTGSGSGCSASFPGGSSVTLTAAPASSFVFQGWSGGGCTGTSTCTVTLNSDTTVTASFARAGGPGELFGLTAGGHLVSFERATPGIFATDILISGLGGDPLIGIDTRPADGLIYGVTRGGKVVQLDPVSGAASNIRTLVPDGSDATPFTGLSGSQFGVDFNPVVDRLRVVSDSGQNLRINVDNGAVISDEALNPGSPSVTAAAYTFNFVGGSTTGTKLYVIDTGSDMLMIQDPANSGTLTAVGPLGGNAPAAGDLEIVGTNQDAFAVFKINPAAAAGTLFRIDLNTGRGERVNDFPGSDPVIDIAGRITPVPPPPGDIALLTQTGKLLTVNRASPDTLRTSAKITGLDTGFSAVDIDYRGADRALYALATNTDGNGRIYVIDPATAIATRKSIIPSSTTLSGNLNIDFNAVTNQLRIVSSSGQNLLVNPDSGAVTADTSLPGTAAINSVGYTDGFLRAGTTTLYVINGGNLQQLSATGGTLTTVGNLGLPAAATVTGFDVDAVNNEGLISTLEGTENKLYRSVVTAGTSSLVASLPTADALTGIAKKPPAEPEIYAITLDNEDSVSNPQGTDGLPANRLLRFGAASSAKYTDLGAVLNADGTPLASSFSILAMDFRPRDGALVVLAKDAADAKLFTLDLSTRQLKPLSTLQADPGDTGTATDPAFNPASITGAAATVGWGMDFPPVPSGDPLNDQVRIISRAASVTNLNLRVTVSNGNTITDTPTTYTPFAITGLGYTDSTSSPTLYGIDSANDRLMTVAQSPSPTSPGDTTGNIVRVTEFSSLGIDIPDINGFDITPTASSTGGSQLLLVGRVGGSVKLYAINLAFKQNAATERGNIGVGSDLVGFASSTAAPYDLYALTTDGQLVSFTKEAPGTILTTATVRGIGTSETVIGMDIAPASGTALTETFYVVTQVNGTANGKLYRMTSGGVATAVTPATGSATFVLPANSTKFGVALNPTSGGGLRITGDGAGVIEIDLSTLAIKASYTMLQTQAVVAAVAHTGGKGLLGQQLLALDSSAIQRLMTVGKATPNDGLLLNIRPMGLRLTSNANFDILGGSDGFAISVSELNDGGAVGYSSLYRVGLEAGSTNSLTAVDDIGTDGTLDPLDGIDHRALIGASAARFPTN